MELQVSADGQDTVLQTLNDQINWYERKARDNQRWYRRVKVVELALATAVPPLAGLRAGPVVVTVVSSLVVLLEGLQHLFQFHANWISYRATSEALKQEQFLFVAQAGPYATAANPRVLLAERFQAIASQENSSWASTNRPALEGTAATAAG